MNNVAGDNNNASDGLSLSVMCSVCAFYYFILCEQVVMVVVVAANEG